MVAAVTRDPLETGAIERHMRTRGFAERLGISHSLAKLIVARREIDHVKIGTAVLIPESAVQAYLDRRRVKAGTPEAA